MSTPNTETVEQPVPALPALEGPFTYASGWSGYYDPSVGLYLDRSDMYMPRDFDPTTALTYSGQRAF